MTTQEFRELVSRLDHYYQYTDDHKVWRREQAKWDRVNRLAKDNPEFMVILKESEQ